MGNPALTATAIRYGLNAAGASSLSDDQLRKFISLRQAKGATIAAKPKVKPKKIVPKNLFAPVKPKPVRKFTPPSPLGAITHTKGTPVASQGPVTQAVEVRRPEAVRQQSQQRQETIRRQQLLRQNGFPVVVDGIWGPRSQAAWVKYKRHVPLPGRAVTKTAHPNQALPFSNISAETKRQQREFQAQKEKEQRQAERAQAVKDRKAAHLADVKIKRQQAALIANAKVLRQHPQVAAKWNLKQLTAVLTDKKTGFDLATSKAAASAIQYHLQAHGYNVKVTGKPDQQTFTVLKTAFREEDLRAQAKRLTAIHDQVYAPLGLKAGDRPKGFPTGTVPTPRELDLILQKGGPKANQIMRYLNRHVVTSHDAWDAARWRQLEFIAEKRNPRFAAKKLVHPSHADILTALAAPFDYVGAKGRASLPEKDQKLAQFKGKTVWNSQLHAILTSDNPAEMKRKLVAYDAVNEQKFKRMQAEQAAHKSFWGKAFDDLLEPGKWTFTAGTVATSRLIQEGARLTGQDVGERDVSWEDAQIMLGYAKPGDFPGYDDLAHKASGWLTVPGSLIIDPLNFVAPFKSASTLARFGRGASSLGHYTIEGEGLGKTLAYTKGTWSKAELARKIPGAVTVADSKSGQAAISFGKKLVEDKEKALAIVRGNVAQAARHAFQPANVWAKKAIRTKKPTNLADIQDGKASVRAWIEDPRNPELQGLVDELKKTHASIYVDAPRSTMSNVGASVLANWAEKVRVLAAHQMAQDSAVKMISDLGYEQAKSDADAAYNAYRKGTGTLADARAAGAKRNQIADEITQGYIETVDNAGTYIKGGALKDDGHLLGKSILGRTLQKMDAIEDTILPTIQDILESHADEMFAAAKAAKAAGHAVPELAARGADDLAARGAALGSGGRVGEEITHPLWDKAGLWAGRNGEEADALRARSRAAFDEENLAAVPNPAHDVPHTGGEMADAIQFEVRRGLPRIYNFAHREKMRLGSEFRFDAEAAANELEKEIRHSWEQRPDGHWYDTRPSVKINKLYARNFKEVADSFLGDLKNYLTGDGELDLPGLEQIAAYGPTGVAHGFDDASNALLWQLGSRVKKMPGFENVLTQVTTRVRHVPGPPPDYVTGAKAKGDWYNAEFARLGEFNSAVSSYRVALVKGADEVLPSELSKSLLFMRALAVHQSKWAKATYLALNGFLRAWKFATLPLRPGWVVRNTVDNFAKAMVRSVRDPRMLLLGGERPGALVGKGYEAVRTVFDIGVSPLRGAIRLLDGLFNTHALDEFDKMMEIFWNYPPEILTKFFDLAALPAPPQSVLDSSRFSRQLDDWRAGNRAPVNVTLSDYANAEIKPPLRLQKAADKRAYEQMMLYGNPTAAQRLAYKMRKTPETLWDLMGNRPENYFKRVIYRSELKKELSRLTREGVITKPGKPTALPILDLLDSKGLERLADMSVGADKVVINKAVNDWFSLGEWNVTPELTEAIRRAGFELPPAENFSFDLSIDEQSLEHAFHDNRRPLSGGTPGAEAFETGSHYEILFTAPDGQAAGFLLVKKGEAIKAVYVKPEFRRQGIATKMYEKAAADGIDIEGLSGTEDLTAQGARFLSGRRSKAAAKVPVPEVLDETTIQMLAHEKAWDVVNETLFDYGKVSVVEDNLRVFMPFIQFWRKNTWFWMQTGVSKPWLPLSVLKLDEQRRMAHDDLPDWMKRYFHTDEIVDAAGVIPGLDTLVQMILPNNQMTDPTSFLSFAPLHRVFRDLVYGENQFLPPEDRAHGIAAKIIGPIVQAMDEWGLGLNPIVRKPMEVTGLIDSRDWQAVFPQTSLAEAFTLKFWGKDAMFKVAQWERVFTLGDDVHADKIAANFDFYVNREMAHQIIKGEPADRAKAEATVKATIWTQQLWGYFGGTYWRRATPEDIYIAKLQDDLRKGQIDFDHLPDKTKQILAVWSHTTGGAEAFDRYLASQELIKAFYKEPDADARAEMLTAHPALSEYVQVKSKPKGIGKNWIRNAQRYTETSRYFEAVKWADAIGATSEERQIAYDMFVTPDLKAFWDSNDTPKQIQDKMVKGEIYREMKGLQDAYFKIPETDFEARDGFLNEHPELTRYWQRHNDPADNYEAIMGGVKSDLRNLYFETVNTKGFAAAAPILKQFPFMFEGTKSEKKIKDGEWIVGYGKKGWDDARRTAWKGVQSYAHWFFNSYVKKVGFDAAFAWAEKQAATDPNAKAFLDYIHRYGKHHGSGGHLKPGWTPERLHAWSNIADFATNFFDVRMKQMGSDKAWDWLHSSNDPRAKALISYLAAYGKHSGGKLKPGWTPARLHAWSNVADFATNFFDVRMKHMGSDAAWDWLHASNDPKAKALISYLARYGKHDGKKLKPGWTPARVEAWSNVADFAKEFFEHTMKTMGSDKAWDWLHASDDPKAKALIAYLGKYGDHDGKKLKPGWTPARVEAWSHVADFAKNFFDVRMKTMGSDKAWDWLHASSDPKAKALIAYLGKYGDHDPKKLKPGWTPARQAAWGNVADFATNFFDVRMKNMGADKAWDWLHASNDPKAKALISYLAKYGDHQGKKLKPGWTPARVEAWSHVADFAKEFFDVRMKSMGEDKAWDWLHNSTDPQAKALLAYLHKYPSKASTKLKPGWTPARQQAWANVADFAKNFFDVRMKTMGEDKAWAWLRNSSDPKAKALVAYMHKYPSKDSTPKPGWTPERTQAWSEVADFAKQFFDVRMKAMGQQKAFDWLHDQAATNPQAQALLDYFAKYPGKKDPSKPHPSDNWSPERKAHWATVAHFARWFYDFYLPKVGEDKAWSWLRDQQGATAKQFMSYVDKYSTKEGKGKFSAERRNAYLGVKDFMGWFFDTYLPKVGEKRAYEWLRNSNDPQAQAAVAYLQKYGKHSQKSIDYKKAQHWLTLYHDLPEDQRQAWLDAGSEGAKIVRWYFDKYASSFDLTQHGKDYAAIQPDLKSYFAMPKEQRTAWLDAGSPEATRVLAYFKKYGKAHQYEREFKQLVAAYPALANGTPEQARRIQFWTQYFALTPDERPAFVHKHAEEYGVFIYGDLSETQRNDDEAEYDRRAVGLGISSRASDFLYVRPLLAYYETLGTDNKQLFLKANPELQDYFDKYSTYSPTGDAKLDLVVEHYFLLPQNSLLRSQMLKDHPELQDYFDAKASPAVAAMRNVLEQYFAIKNPSARKDFLLKHPEIRDYFDQRKAEKASEAAQLGAFEQADPRLKPYFKDNQDMRRSADMMARKLHHAAISSLEDATAELQLRRERQSAA